MVSLLLYGTEQHLLGFHNEVAHFVQKQCTAICLLKDILL